MSAKRPVASLVHLEEVGCDIIIVNVLADRVRGSAARHLDPRWADHDVHSITTGLRGGSANLRLRFMKWSACPHGLSDPIATSRTLYAFRMIYCTNRRVVGRHGARRQ
jgi:hypothetical protein